VVKGKKVHFPHGEAMIHQLRCGQGTSADLNHGCSNKKIKDLGAKIIADNCGQTFEKVMKDFDRDYWMDGEESVKYGIVDAVINKI
jgi:ATP-dependent Clp protease protease subunit